MKVLTINEPTFSLQYRVSPRSSSVEETPGGGGEAAADRKPDAAGEIHSNEEQTRSFSSRDVMNDDVDDDEASTVVVTSVVAGCASGLRDVDDGDGGGVKHDVPKKVPDIFDRMGYGSSDDEGYGAEDGEEDEGEDDADVDHVSPFLDAIRAVDSGKVELHVPSLGRLGWVLSYELSSHLASREDLPGGARRSVTTRPGVRVPTHTGV